MKTEIQIRTRYQILNDMVEKGIANEYIEDLPKIKAAVATLRWVLE